MVRKVFLLIGIFFVAFFGRSFFTEYFALHTYYYQMLESRRSGRIVLSAVIFGLLPTIYLLFAKKKNFWGIVGAILVGLWGYGLAYLSIRNGLIAGWLKFLFNTTMLFGLAVYTLTAFVTLGNYIKERWLSLPTKSIFGVIMSMGLGLIAFLLINYVLIVTTLYYSIISWLLFVGAGVLIYLQRTKLQSIWEIVTDSIDGFVQTKRHHVRYAVFAIPFLVLTVFMLLHEVSSFRLYIVALLGLLLVVQYLKIGTTRNNWGLAYLQTPQFWTALAVMILLLVTFYYLYQGFMLAYIPYSTAWDANHAYMFYPRMWSLNHGYYRDEINMGRGSVQLWQAYIAYRFSLFTGTGGFFGLSADTVAIEMNFWSGIFVLLFGLGLISELVGYLHDQVKRTASQIGAGKIVFLLGWLLLLLWLTSGMGAFLVFIDNKTDLGIMALVILALYSGFVFLRYFARQGDQLDSKGKTYLILSGVFFGFAALAKPTALFDVVNFGLLMWILWIGVFGAIGLFLLIIGVMSMIEFRGINTYMTPWLGKIYAAIGGGALLIDLVRGFWFKSLRYLRVMVIWVIAFASCLLVIKGPFVLVDNIVHERERGVGETIQRIFLSHSLDGREHPGVVSQTAGLAVDDMVPLLVQATGSVQPAQPAGPEICTLASVGADDIQELYDTVKEVRGTSYDIDVGRYVGYGWKGGDTGRKGIEPFVDPRWGGLLSVGCHGFSPLGRPAHNAVVLCENEEALDSYDPAQLEEIQEELTPGSEQAQLIEELIEGIRSAEDTTTSALRLTYGDLVRTLDAHMQDYSIKVIEEEGQKSVYMPYKFLNFFNISFNWSLQNLSSYYTDIGVVWLMLILMLVLGLITGIIMRKRFLTAISLVTIFGRLLWHLIAGGILWYAIGIIIWTILAFLTYVYVLLDSDDQDTKMLSYIFLGAFVIFGGVQLVLNIARISSQGGGGAFLWYKSNYGRVEEFTDTLARETPVKAGFGKDDVFAMQFPHYRDVIDAANERDDEQGVYIAGTYLRYFIDNQHHIKYDQQLEYLWQMVSDADLCKSYLRLKDNRFDYLVVDPNIGTVVQGEGNRELFDRFFARVDNSTNEIYEDGVFTMLAKLASAGYIEYFSSNNLGAKYALMLPDSVFGGLEGDELALFRARMALMRFFGGTNSNTFGAAVNIAMQRVEDGTFVLDLADAMGLQVRDDEVLEVARLSQVTPEDLEDLTQDERKALAQYLGLRRQAQGDQSQLQQSVAQIVANSIGAGNQIIVLELAE